MCTLFWNENENVCVCVCVSERERERESFWWKDRETCFHFCLAFLDLSCMCAHICNRLFLNFYFLISVLWISSVQHTFILVLVISKKTHNQINILLFINSHPKTHFEKTWSILMKILNKVICIRKKFEKFKSENEK